MLKKILRILFTIIGLVLGFILGKGLLKTDYIGKVEYFKTNPVLSIVFVVFCVLLFGFIMFLISPIINSAIMKVMEYVESNFQRVPANDILFGTVGAILGLIIAVLITSTFSNFGALGTILSILIAVIMAALGVNISIRKKEEITNFFSNFKKVNAGKDKKSKTSHKVTPKVLDTSVIIDGRILDICQTGFIEGTLVIPTFVLEELRHIADSSDSLKRNRGRRGLDILNKIQKELKIDVQIYEKDFPDIAEVDSKLLKLAQVLEGKVITNDYNLNKVAQFQGVDVLNINELANAVKPMVLPGEEMLIPIVKDGKESGQGIGYLDDGTMIVVEGGRKYMGETKYVTVTSVLQTAAGRMIFAKPKD
ncbi:PIN/TRAM domain-containing protein [Haloimpatiens massiliensis]|uniref:PIN/TRAM domain-containing protein n=1 Tax=Haloimpatiens massiliensis TaxID=1658110 RepID=UPI000C81CC50|nr:PIN/TRAM domain-containing protein [Haloimpatiens massiliensis]